MMSMTGYGHESFTFGDTTITIEIRSVNHRFLDISTKIPRSFLFLEEKLKQIIKKHFTRGRIEVYIGIDGDKFVNKTLFTDWDLMDQYIQQVNKVKTRYNLSGEIPISIINAIPELMTVQEDDYHPNELKNLILDGLVRTCKQVLAMRQKEGKHLHKDIKTRMKSVENLVKLFEGRRNQVIGEYRERIQNRIKEYVGDAIALDTSRVYQEIALLAEKGDISEEITRLNSHIDHFCITIEQNEPMGRKLDFIIQEIHREANTIGSKSTDSKIGEWSILLKSNIEKIKEQVQNIE